MQRPAGVTILALLAFIGAGALVLGACGMFLGGAVISAIAMRPGIRMLAGLGGAFIAVVLLCFAILELVIGLGLWKLQNWARVVTIVLTALSLASAGFGLLFSMGHMFGFFFFPMFLRRLIVAAIDLWVILYLLKPHVKQAFGATSF